MEEGLLMKERSYNKRLDWGEAREEMKRLANVAAPMVAVNLSFYLLQVISVMMAGHLGELALSSTSIGVSLGVVTGLSLILGMAGGLETLSGQAFGAQEYQKVGTQTYTAIFCLVLVCIPLSVLWLYTGDLLKFVGQEPQISTEAGKFLTGLIPTLFGYAFLQPLIRFYQIQSLIVPMLISSFITICFHIPVCWALVYKTALGNHGAAVALGLSTWLNVGTLSLYMKYSPACLRTRSPISFKIFYGIKEFFRFAVPSAVMTCLEWCSFELLVLLSGLLPNPQLETSVLAVCLNTLSTIFSIPFGLAVAASTRIANELGAGNPHLARVSFICVMFLATMNGFIVSSILFFCRGVFGYVFINDTEVVKYVASMAPLLCISVVFDSLQGTMSGVIRGCGWQDIGAYLNLAAFYLVGIPVAVLLAFLLKFGGRGLWIGIVCGASTQVALYGAMAIRINWEKQATEARKRVLEVESSSAPHDEVS